MTGYDTYRYDTYDTYRYDTYSPSRITLRQSTHSLSAAFALIAVASR